MGQLDEKTKVTFGVVMVLLGFSTWLSQIYAQGNSNAAAIEDIKSRQTKLESIQTDVAVIKAQLQPIQQALNELRGYANDPRAYQGRAKPRSE